MNTYLSIGQAWKLIRAFSGAISYDVNIRQWGQALPCVFFHQQGNPCCQITGYVNIAESEAALLCKRHNASLVTIDREDIGDDDRRDIVVIICQGNAPLAFANTFADAKAWVKKNGFIIKSV